MALKTRVEKYKEYREKISQMYNYPFSENSEEHTADKNTLSISVDELLEAHDERKNKKLKRESKKKFHTKKREEKRKAISKSTVAIFILISIVVIVFIVFLSLNIAGVI